VAERLVEDGPVTTDTGSAAPESQAVIAPLTGAAIFLVAVLTPGEDSAAAVRTLCADLSALVRAVGFRDLDGHLTCVTGFGAAVWDRIAGPGKPAGLHPFREIKAGPRHAVATAGDVLFHIRATRMDLCFELASQLMSRLGHSVTVVSEVHGFRYFDDRDLIGFVDGTENPTGAAAARAALIGDEDPRFAGGSYVIVQEYLHDVAAWNALPVEEQEHVIGRTKLSDIELPDALKPVNSHVSLNTIVDPDGTERQILRANMPFGKAGSREFGTYFIGYAATPSLTELMLSNMFIGRPPGNYDRILDFSTAVTGNLFFVPSADFLDDLPPSPGLGTSSPADDSRGIGDLKRSTRP
jgi:putative iron-dependent peroxidase